MINTNLDAKIVREERALSRLFTQKQVAIIKKILALEQLSNSENVVYSKTIKPRLNAIIDLQSTALAARYKL